MALTDHDTTVGWEEAQGTADEPGIRPVKGIELSTRNLGLRVTGPSDHHGTRRNDHDPGCNLTTKEEARELHGDSA